MKELKIHLAGADPWEGKGGSVYRYLGCTNPKSETAVSVRMDSNWITTDPSEVTCWRCKAKMNREVREEAP